MDRNFGFVDFLRLSRMRIASIAALCVVSVLLVYSVFAFPGAAPQTQGTGGWLSSNEPSWTPHPTSTNALPDELRLAAYINRQHLFLSRVRVRHPDFDGVYVLDALGDPDYWRGGGVDIAIHAATDLIDVVPRGRYFIGESGAGESSDWRLSYEDLPILIRTGDETGMCVRPWNWFQLGDRDNFLDLEIGDTGYHSYEWPFAWNYAMDAIYYPGMTGLGLTYGGENKPYAFGVDRDEVYMEAGSEVLFRDVVSYDRDMPDSHYVGTLCGPPAQRSLYADSPLYREYLTSSGGKYEWKLSGLSFLWVYPVYDPDYVAYGSQPRGNLVVSPEMLYLSEWPEMEHPDLDNAESAYNFRVLDIDDDMEDRTFMEIPSDAKGDVEDLYGDGKIEIMRNSVNPDEICSEFTVVLNTIEYTPTYLAGGVEAHCRGVGANFNHMSMLMRNSRVVSMHPSIQSEPDPGVCDPTKPDQISRECLDLNVGIEGRVVQRQEVFVYLYYRIYEQRYDSVNGKWELLDPMLDTLIQTNDPRPDYASAFVADPVRMEYALPDDGVDKCDYRNPGHSQEKLWPDDKYVGSFKVELPPTYRVVNESDRRRQFAVYLEVDMVHQIEIGGTGPGLDHRLDSGPFDMPGCEPDGAQVDRGLWNYSERKLCPDGTENCALWMGPPAKWKAFDLFRPTVTPAPASETDLPPDG